MSTVSQTLRVSRVSFRLRFVLSMMAATGLVVVAMTPAGGALLRVVAQGRLHAPNLAIWAQLSLPIQIHLLTALGALMLGGVLMIVRKGRTFHRVAGWSWVALVAMTAGVTLLIRDINHGDWSLLHLFTAWTLLILPLGVIAAKRRSVVQHRRRMTGLFYGAFAINLAFAFIPGRTLWVMFFG